MEKKLLYDSPTSKIYEVRMEGMIAVSGGGGIDNADEDDYDEI